MYQGGPERETKKKKEETLRKIKTGSHSTGSHGKPPRRSRKRGHREATGRDVPGSHLTLRHSGKQTTRTNSEGKAGIPKSKCCLGRNNQEPHLAKALGEKVSRHRHLQVLASGLRRAGIPPTQAHVLLAGYCQLAARALLMELIN